LILWLTRAYFAANSLLYAVIAIKTIYNPDAGAAAIGYALSSAKARSEFITAYAGLLLGIAAMFAVFASKPNAHAVGLSVAVMFYVPIIACRIVPHLFNAERFAIDVGATSVELLLLAGALALSVSL
jgi:hypothetical protein